MNEVTPSSAGKGRDTWNPSKKMSLVTILLIVNPFGSGFIAFSEPVFFVTKAHYLSILESTYLSEFSNRFSMSYSHISVLVVKILSR